MISCLYKRVITSVVDLVLNVGDLDVEDLGEDGASGDADLLGLVLDGLGVVVVDGGHLDDVVLFGGLSHVDDVEGVDGQGGHGVETA